MNGGPSEALPASIRIADVATLARARNASDVHLTVGMPPILRVDGELEKTTHAPIDAAELRDLARALLRDDGVARLDGAGDATGAFSDPRAGRMRVHVYAAGRVPQSRSACCTAVFRRSSHSTFRRRSPGWLWNGMVS